MTDHFLLHALPTLAEESENDEDSPLEVRLPKRNRWTGEIEAGPPAPHRLGGLNPDEYTLLYMGDALLRATIALAGKPVGAEDEAARPCATSRCEEEGALKTAAAFRKVFGAELYAGKRMAREQWSERGSQYFYRFNTQSLIRAFERLYQKPGTRVLGFETRTFYKYVFRYYVRGLVRDWKPFLERKKEVIDCAASVYRKRELPEWFSAHSEPECKESPDPAPLGFHKTYWFLVRREADGSLPAMLFALRAVLKDYDPKTYAKVKSLL
jgi:hypothetical protein